MLPANELPAGGTQDEFTERADESAFLCKRNELDRRDDAARGMTPADQRLDTGRTLR